MQTNEHEQPRRGISRGTWAALPARTVRCLRLAGTAALVVTAMVCVLMLIGAPPAAAQPAPANPLAAQSSQGGGVTVKVTPKNLAVDSRQWEFEVVFDTHSVDLSQDLTNSAALIDASGRVHVPLAWGGDPPGGHHRKGVLSFKPLGAVDEVTLQIRDVGMPERVFRWSLKGMKR